MSGVASRPNRPALFALTLPVVVLVAGLGANHQTPQTAPQIDTPRFDIERVADGVYAAIRSEPAGLMLDANSVFIVNDDDVVVVDTNITPSSARASLAALRKITSKPVSHVINTHWHDDHVIGNQVYKEAFPSAQFIGQANFREELTTTGAANRQTLVGRGQLMITQFRVNIEQSKSMTGGTLTDEERVSYQNDLEAVDRYCDEAPGFQIVLPTITVEDRLTLVRGRRAINILYFGRAHTASDLVVQLPAERVVITGDLVAAPVPLLVSTSHPLEFGVALDQLLALKPAIIIPGHGPVMRDDSYVRQEARLVAAIKQQVEAAVARGATLEEARRTVDLDAMRKVFAGDSQLKSFIFSQYVALSGVTAAYRDATGRR